MASANREIVIRMLDDGKNGYIVGWPKPSLVTPGNESNDERNYAFTNIADLVKFLEEKLNGELPPNMEACREGR